MPDYVLYTGHYTVTTVGDLVKYYLHNAGYVYSIKWVTLEQVKLFVQTQCLLFVLQLCM